MKEEARARGRLRGEHRPRGPGRTTRRLTRALVGCRSGPPQHTGPSPPCPLPSSSLARLRVRACDGPSALTRVPRPQDALLPPGAAVSLTWMAPPPLSSPHGSHGGPQACARASPAKSPPVPPTPPESNRTPSQGVSPGAHPLGALATSPPLVLHRMESPPPPQKPLSHSSQGQHLPPTQVSA